MTIEAYPLHWPLMQSRTQNRKKSAFKQTPDQAQRLLRLEIDRIKATDLIISTNIPVRGDGHMYSSYMVRTMDDPGVAIYFKYKGQDVVMCCDQYRTVFENIYALAKSIESIRAMARWGVSDIIARTFQGFKQLQAPAAAKPWWQVLGFTQKPLPKPAEAAVARTRYRELQKQHHPDTGTGNTQALEQAQNAYKEAQQYFGNIL